MEKFSMVDFDSKIACTLFTERCNFCCPFCHNSNLVLETNAKISENEILEYLKKRKGMIDAVCISGGEPTLQIDLPNFAKKIKDIGLLVKLDTNGTNPIILKKMIDENLVDYVAMDIKNSLDSYAKTIGFENCQIPTLLGNVQKSVEILKQGCVEFEFRTTLIEEFHTENDILKMAKWLYGTKKMFFQHFKDGEGCIERGLHEIPKETAMQFANIMKEVGEIEIVELRGY